MLTTDGEGEKLQKATLKEVNDPVVSEKKPRTTLFYTCQAVRLVSHGMMPLLVSKLPAKLSAIPLCLWHSHV